MTKPMLVRIYMPTYLKQFYKRNPHLGEEVYSLITILFTLKLQRESETNLFDNRPKNYSSFIEIKYPKSASRDGELTVFTLKHRLGRMVVNVLRQHFRNYLYNFVHTWRETRTVKYCFTAFMIKHDIDGYISEDGLRKAYYKQQDKLHTLERIRLIKHGNV